MRWLWLVLVPALAHADSWHAGLDLRADPGAHPVRACGGYEHGVLDATLVLDPMALTDGQHDIDLYTHYKLSRAGWSFLSA